MDKIGDLIPRGRTTLLHGRSGSGKSYSMLKYFKECGVVPVFIDFDHNEEYNSSDIVHIYGPKLADDLFGDDKELAGSILKELVDRVVVIDTYAMTKLHLESVKKVHSFIDALNDNGCTVVVVAHTAYYSGKPAEPDVDMVWANHVACRLHLHNEVKKTKIDIYLEVEKLRGYKGPALIYKWMR